MTRDTMLRALEFVSTEQTISRKMNENNHIEIYVYEPPKKNPKSMCVFIQYDFCELVNLRI